MVIGMDGMSWVEVLKLERELGKVNWGKEKKRKGLKRQN